jgi:hypothetical protein
MVESIVSGTAAAPIPAAKPPLAADGRPQQYYPDGSAVPDVIAFHHRPDDLGIEGSLVLPEASPEGSNFFGEDGLTFGDLLDIINPLQHIPIVSTIYRAITGDEISPGSRLAGGALFGGPIGAGLAMVNAMVEQSSGMDIGDTVLAALTGDDAEEAGTVVAEAGTTDAEPAAPVATPAATEATAKFMPVHAPIHHKPLNNQTASLPTASGMPFGRIGALPFAGPAQETENPVAAVLQARAAVPVSGPVRGLAAATPAVATQPHDIPTVSSRLSDKLAALAARTAPPERHAEKPAEKPADKAEKDKGNSPVKEEAVAAAAAPKPGLYVPPSLIPQTMMSTLERYQQMKQAEGSGVSG